MSEDVLIEEIKESDERELTHKDKTTSHLAYVIVLTFAISVILSFGMSIYLMVRNIDCLRRVLK